MPSVLSMSRSNACWKSDLLRGRFPFALHDYETPIMNITLTTLCDNTVGKPEFMAEWVLSILVQANGMNILFDTGWNMAAVRNAINSGSTTGITSSS